MKKIFKIYNRAALIALPIGIVVLYFVAPMMSDNIYESKSLKVIPKSMKLIHDKAAEYKHSNGVWPSSLDFISSKPIYLDTTSFTFNFEVLGDTLVVKAIVEEGHPRIHRKFIGGFVTVDNFGNKTYSHDEFKSKYLGAYLMDAKKVEGN